MATWIATGTGLLVLAVLCLDVFRTVFHAEGRGGPLNRRQNRLIWGVVRAVGTAGGRARPGVLALGGSVIAVTTIVVWGILLVAGFWLLYLPHVASFHYSPGEPGNLTVEAAYYSGMIASTLGLGDMVAPDGWLRIATVIQALAGFALLTVGVTYILGVYRELLTAQTLASTIHARFRAGPDDLHPADLARTDAMDWDRSMALRLAHALEAHYNYPILHYFRPAQDRRSLPAQVALLLDLERQLEERARNGDEEAARQTDSLSRRTLMAVVQLYAAEIHALFVRQDEPEEGGGREKAALRLDEILGMLGHDRDGRETARPEQGTDRNGSG